MTNTKITAAFVALMVIISGMFLTVLRPFYGAVLWSVILAILFHPIYLRLLRQTGHRGNLASGLTVLFCICLVFIPATFLVGLLVREATSAYQALSSQNFDLATELERMHGLLPQSIQNMLDRVDVPSVSEIASRLSSFVQSAVQVVAKSAYSFSQGAIGFTIAFGVTLYLLFFFFRDGEKLTVALRRASPFNRDQTDKLLRTFAAVVTATVKGNIVIAIVQGGVGGVTFWLMGIQGAVLWGVVMAVLSLVPAVGAGLVWVPVAIYFLATGAFAKGIILILVGIFIIGMVDNLLRPTLVGKQTNMPDYLVLISTLGGLAVFGINGFVLGPLIAALFLTVWKIYIQDRDPRIT